MSNKNLLSSRGWSILFNYLFRYKKEVILLSIFGLISALANASVPFLVGKFFDTLLEPSTTTVYGYVLSTSMFVLIVWALIQVIANIVDLLNARKRRGMGIHIHASYSAEASSRLLSLPLSFHKDHKHGDTWDKITKASSALSSIIERVVIELAPQFLSVTVGVVIAYYINPILATVLITGVLIYVITLMKIVPPIIKLQKRGHKAWNKAFSTAYDAVANFQTVKQSTAETYETKRIFRYFMDGAYKTWFKVQKIWVSINFFQRLTVVLTQLTIFIISASFVQNGTLTIGELVALNGYSAMVFGPFVQLGYNWQITQNGIIAIERADDILKTSDEFLGAKDKILPKEIHGDVEFKNVSFAYSQKDKNVLKNIDMSIKQGEIVAFVGESGVGKSTAIELISGYYFPTRGAILVDGYDTREINLGFLRDNIAVVPQEVVLFNDTIEMNIKYGTPRASRKLVQNAAKKARADEFIKKFPKGYKQLVGERGIKLSVGQKQRIAIARAILRDPKILILDEPTSALDSRTERDITISLRELMKDRTTFIIAHRMSTVRHADKIFVFEAGKVVETGKHDELIKKKGLYNKLYSLHIGLK